MADTDAMLKDFEQWKQENGVVGGGTLLDRIYFAGWQKGQSRALASRPAEVDDEGLSALPTATAWVHTLDNTDGLSGNKPYVVLTSSKKNPFGKPGIDYSKSYPVTSEPLFTAEQFRQGQRDAVAADRARLGEKS